MGRRSKRVREGYLGEIEVRRGPIRVPLSVFKRGSIPRYNKIKGKPSPEQIRKIMEREPPEVYVKPRNAEEISTFIHKQLAVHLKMHGYIGENWVKVSSEESERKLASILKKRFPDAEFLHQGYCKADLTKKSLRFAFHEKPIKQKLSISELIKAISESEWEILE